MSDNSNTYLVDFGPHADFTPYVPQGSNDWLAQDGYYAVKIVEASTYYSKPKVGEEPKPMVKLHLVVQDEDGKGSRLIANITAGGVDKNGNHLSRQLMETLASSGMPIDKIREEGKKGTKVALGQLVQQLVDRIGYANVESEYYADGDRWSSKVQGWIDSEAYNKAVSVTAHRRPRKQTGGAATGGQAALQAIAGGGLSGVTMGGAGARNGSDKPAVSQFDKLS